VNLSTSVTVVTGGSGGFGAATAARVARAGGMVVVGDLATPPSGVFEGVEDRVHFVKVDVTDEESVSGLVEAAAERGTVRGVVHTPGGGGKPTRLVNRDGEPYPLEQFKSVVNLNLVGTFNTLRLFAAHMAATDDDSDAERGSIVMTASIAAYEGQVGQAAYAASKAALVGLTLTAARDLADLRIRVNTIAPGTFDTPLLARFSNEIKDRLASAVPSPRRLGRPEEYAALAEHMLTNEYLNGEVVRLDGAMRMSPR
jgi:NAD(P)-dependent dehydrogenase (short-subunit alcohol dehydrogenase family)